MRRTIGLLGLGILVCQGCGGWDTGGDPVVEAQAFLDEYTAESMRLSTAAAEAEWLLNTHIVEGDDSNAKRVEQASGAYAAFTGSEEVITRTRALLEDRDRLRPIQVRQLEAVLYAAANNPSTVPELVEQRIAAEAAQTEALFGYDFQLNGASVSTNELDRILRESEDVAERLAAWESSKQVGPGLRDGLVKLVGLRNATVQALGYDNYFQYQVSDYDRTVDEMLALNEQFLRETRPLYRELHTWARHELARRYGAEVPDLIPAHWLPNRWGQDWSALVDVEGFDLDAVLQSKDPEWFAAQAERFYVSLGFEPLPESFWDKSSLYPAPADAPYSKNNHASAWHMDLERDVRCLMSVVPTAEWYETTHHELGHIYYYLAYTNPQVPPLLREGANRAFHEGIGSLLGLASMQKAFVQGLGLLPEDAQSDETMTLLKEALNFLVFLPFASGTMTFFEKDLYAGLPADQYNQRWWEYVARFQGIAPPSPRGEEFCDAATKTHINDDAAQYYDYALSYILLHQFHAHIANQILEQDPRNTNYFGRKDVGAFLQGVLEVGATRDGQEVMREAVGEDLSANAMLDYFAPLTEWLKEQNQGRTSTLPELE